MKKIIYSVIAILIISLLSLFSVECYIFIMKISLPNNLTLKNTYGKTFGRIGVALQLSRLDDQQIEEMVKANYNSITLENDMKPDAILTNELISVNDAKKLGYVIPENYKEDSVPQLNFSTIDKALKWCADNDFGLRAHTLVWSHQTPDWFFNKNYSESESLVSQETMDARLEFYIRSVMGHVYENQYGYVVYSWDVVNEYIHFYDTKWAKIYGNPVSNPSYVKLAFEIASDVLESYNIRDKVTLIYNEYGMDNHRAKILDILNFINADKKYCDGLGIQAHLSSKYTSVYVYKTIFEYFLNEGYQIYLTEMDISNDSEVQQANFSYEFMEMLLDLKHSGAEINGITYWGISDNYSYLKKDGPLLFSEPNKPKLSYYKALKAYVDSDFYKK